TNGRNLLIDLDPSRVRCWAWSGAEADLRDHASETNAEDPLPSFTGAGNGVHLHDLEGGGRRPAGQGAAGGEVDLEAGRGERLVERRQALLGRNRNAVLGDLEAVGPEAERHRSGGDAL